MMEGGNVHPPPLCNFWHFGFKARDMVCGNCGKCVMVNLRDEMNVQYMGEVLCIVNVVGVTLLSIDLQYL